MPTPAEAVTKTSEVLSDAAFDYAKTQSQAHWSQLCQAAESFAKARWAVKAPPKAEASSGLTMPFGNSKGTPLEKCVDKDLRYLVGRLEESILDESKSKWREKNQQLLDAAKAELESR